MFVRFDIVDRGEVYCVTVTAHFELPLLYPGVALAKNKICSSK